MQALFSTDQGVPHSHQKQVLQCPDIRRHVQERETKREDGNVLVNQALSQRAQAEQGLLDRFVSALQGHSRTLEEQLVGDSTQYNELRQRCGTA